VHADTAGAAHDVAQRGDAHVAAIASKLAAEHYGLSVLSGDIADEERNVTRFIILAADRADPAPETQDVMTSLIFQMRSVPAALYKALGGFATNGINLTKLESYIADDTFAVAQFYADVEGHPDHEAMRFALEELSFFTEWYHIVGVYPAAQYRKHT
jgi:prephenate dehydratase